MLLQKLITSGAPKSVLLIRAMVGLVFLSEGIQKFLFPDEVVVAIITTKIPILMEAGFWKMAHDSRTDFSMLLGSLFLLCGGAGSLSVDAWICQRRGWRSSS